jgi:hypothetical protein
MTPMRPALPALLCVLACGCFVLGPEQYPPEPDAAASPQPTPTPVCTAPAADCDQQAGNGCEVNLSSDPEHCGTCEISCHGAGCNDGACGPVADVIVTAQQSPMRLVTNAQHLFFVTATGADPIEGAAFGAIVRAGLDGAEPQEIASGQLGPDGLAVDEAFVYWTNSVSGTVMRLALEGGTPQTIVSGLHAPRDLALHSTGLYFASAVNHVVMRSAPDGSAPAIVAQIEDPVLSVSVNDAAVFFGTASAVARVGHGGGEVTVIAPGQSNVVSLFASTDRVFWVSQGPKASSHAGAIGSVDPEGGTATLIATQQFSPMTVVADDAFVYWTNLSGGTVMKAPLGGGSAVMLASAQPQPWGAALRGDALYWTCFGSGEVRKLMVR